MCIVNFSTLEKNNFIQKPIFLRTVFYIYSYEYYAVCVIIFRIYKFKARYKKTQKRKGIGEGKENSE